MESVGIRELKARLSEYVKRASAGEVIEVTDRGRVVARLSAPGPVPADFPYPGMLRDAAEGRVKLGRYPLTPDLYDWVDEDAGLPEGTTQTLIDFIREVKL